MGIEEGDFVAKNHAWWKLLLDETSFNAILKIIIL